MEQPEAERLGIEGPRLFGTICLDQDVSGALGHGGLLACSETALLRRGCAMPVKGRRLSGVLVQKLNVGPPACETRAAAYGITDPKAERR